MSALFARLFAFVYTCCNCVCTFFFALFALVALFVPVTLRVVHVLAVVIGTLAFHPIPARKFGIGGSAALAALGARTKPFRVNR